MLVPRGAILGHPGSRCCRERERQATTCRPWPIEAARAPCCCRCCSIPCSRPCSGGVDCRLDATAATLPAAATLLDAPVPGLAPRSAISLLKLAFRLATLLLVELEPALAALELTLPLRVSTSDSSLLRP